jgi:integrase
MAAFLDNLETKESTGRRYNVASKALIAFFGKVIVSSIDTADVERFRAWRKKQDKKAPVRSLARNPKARLNKAIRPATVNRELTLLSGLFRSLLRTGKVTANPVTGVTFLRECNDQTRVVTGQEFWAYLMATSQPLRDVAVLMFHTVVRPSEIFNLRKEDLDFETGKIRIATGKTDAARRRLTMSDDARGILQARFYNAKGELLFPGGKKGDKDTPIIKLTNAHHAAIERAKIKTFRLYDLRHTFATHLTQSGVDLMTVKAILGHSRLEMVQRYSHPTEQHQADAIQRLENFRNSTSNIRAIRAFQKTV